MREGSRNKQPKDDFFLKLTLLQLVLCALLFGVFFLAMKLNGDFFARLQMEFSALTAEDHDLNEITFFPPAEEEAAAAADAAEVTTEDETAAPAETEAAAARTGAGGEDLTDEAQLRLVSFACYSTADTPVLPVEGSVTSEFGERVHPIYGTVSFHSGKDLAAPEGSPIYAALDGEVIAAGVGEMSGNYVKLRHEDGLETLYCHCLRLNVETGVKVRKGDVIAFVGQTGLATGPHLHFEVHIDGVKRNPDFLLENAARVA